MENVVLLKREQGQENAGMLAHKSYRGTCSTYVDFFDYSLWLKLIVTMLNEI